MKRVNLWPGVMVLATAGLVAASPPRAVYLVPERFEARVGETVELGIVAWDEGGAKVEIGLDECPTAWYFVRVAGTQANADDVPPSPRGAKAASIGLAVTEAGITMVGADFRARIVDTTLAEFRSFLDRAVTSEDRSAIEKDLPVDRAIRVRHIASAKALLAARDAAGRPPGVDAATATSKAGQTAEIRLLGDPAEAEVGSDIQIRAYAAQSGAGRVRVRAWCVVEVRDDAKPGAVVEPIEFTTDSSGIGRFSLAAPGVWRVEMHRVRRLVDDPDADMEVQSATVIFVAGAGGDR